MGGPVTALTAIGRRMTYKTSKWILIQDYRLAVTNVALQGVILFYVIFSLVSGKAYLQTEVPIGRVSNWGNGNDNFNTIQTTTSEQNTTGTKTINGNNYTLLPCGAGAANNALDAYKFNYSAAWEYENVKCAYMTPDELIWKRVDGGIFFTTHVTQKHTYREPKGSVECNATKEFEAGTSFPRESAAGTAGVCYYKRQTELLAIGAEHVSLGITHEFETKGHAAKMPKTYVRRSGSTETVLTFEAGRPIEMSLKQILDVAQVDLDKRYADQTANIGKDVSGEYGRGDDATRTPMVRLGGVRIFASIKYYNYDLHSKDASDTLSKGNTPYAILEVEPTFTWTGLGQGISYRPSEPGAINDPIDQQTGKPKGYLMDMYRYGVFIDVTTSGIVGVLNVVYIINVIVSGLVMLKVANSVCDMVAMYFLGARSLMYKSHMNEELNFEREAAKFAVQGILSMPSFRRGDASGGGKDGLDIDEIYELVKETFHASDTMSGDGLSKGETNKSTRLRLSEQECRQMARYIVLAGDRQSQANYLAGKKRRTYEELRAERIDLAEWIELCTEGGMDTALLKKLAHVAREEEEHEERRLNIFHEQ
ncbi:P2X purinoreceptor [Ostreococcus tauri]|uniref:P2X purinoreceptor n=1 Tax=Ostreococcus tauri TaxID=70448 RepID=Q00UQ1_OSTTA|nr:P2X purinoreceptor [Ostreococcus tauri]CAL57726.1 P2X purinoreceptor [Ostreococcus tauri]|eukprot:XP_003083450.1 P2X purinoreceptor [Ostreococcus tauri]